MVSEINVDYYIFLLCTFCSSLDMMLSINFLIDLFQFLFQLVLNHIRTYEYVQHCATIWAVKFLHIDEMSNSNRHNECETYFYFHLLRDFSWFAWHSLAVSVYKCTHIPYTYMHVYLVYHCCCLYLHILQSRCLC